MVRIFFYKSSKYVLNSIILLRDRKFIIDQAFLTAPLKVYLYITKIDNKYEECLIGVIHLR